MNGVRPVALLLICTCVAGAAAPISIALWETNDRFIGGISLIGSSTGQPREIGRAELFSLAGVLSALIYLVPASLAFLLFRRFGSGVRNVVTLLMLPVALAFVWWCVTGGS